MTADRLLIFPLDLDEAEPVIRVATALGIKVIGASSAMAAPGGRAVQDFVRLPFVTDPGFDDALRCTINDHGITVVFAPHQGVWRHLDTLLSQDSWRGRFRLCQPEPFIATWQLFAAHEEWASIARDDLSARRIGSDKLRPSLVPASYAALHRQFLGTPGQCDEMKLLALCDIARLLPDGDMLEVGCLYGRSSLALGFLASRHGIGSLICVDPWNVDKVTDQGSQAALLNAGQPHIDYEQIFVIFLSTVAMLENVGYIRATSAAAHATYVAALQAGRLDSPGLGSIVLSRQLSLVHIDGNHRYDHVRQDVALWSPHLARGGWLLLDDYVWAFGDGPQQVGDELLGSPNYDIAFVSGDTLFLRRA
ncbi:MAG: class I SAM-dependent methyltransferase [Rhodocyclales bacterium]|nr:class I SAM-dependent methyltransferase [Rhodocyclales bacterium]